MADYSASIIGDCGHLVGQMPAFSYVGGRRKDRRYICDVCSIEKYGKGGWELGEIVLVLASQAEIERLERVAKRKEAEEKKPESARKPRRKTSRSKTEYDPTVPKMSHGLW